MQIPVKQWYQAISQRHSRRQYNGKTLPNDMVAHLLDFSQKLNDRIRGAKAILVNKSPDDVFKGAVGSYGKIKGAPAYVAFIGNMENPNVQENVGYLGECFVLEATSIGLGTCWVGGFFRPEVVQTKVQISDREKVLAISPLGFVDGRYTLEEKIMSSFAKSRKRKDLEELCLNTTTKESLPKWINTALEVARLAPSALNRQPWRFSIENGSIKISVDNVRESEHISRRLDCGIAMAHIEIGANYEGTKGQWEFLKSPDVARFKLI